MEKLELERHYCTFCGEYYYWFKDPLSRNDLDPLVNTDGVQAKVKPNRTPSGKQMGMRICVKCEKTRKAV